MGIAFIKDSEQREGGKHRSRESSALSGVLNQIKLISGSLTTNANAFECQDSMGSIVN